MRAIPNIARLTIAISLLTIAWAACGPADRPDPTPTTPPAPTATSMPTPTATSMPTPTDADDIVAATPSSESPTPVAPAPTAGPNVDTVITPAPDEELVPAPIDKAAINISDDGRLPELVLETGLPNACHAHAGYRIDETAPMLRLTVLNTRKTGPIACAEIYLTHEVRIALDQDIAHCDSYHLQINDQQHTLTAKNPNTPCNTP